MHTLLLIMEGRENAIGLQYRSHEAADAARERIMKSGATIDDFGHHVIVHGGIIATIIADVEREHEAQSEIALSQARAQAAAQAKANADPKMRFLTGQTPASRLVG